jgi:hypothetical protein
VYQTVVPTKDYNIKWCPRLHGFVLEVSSRINKQLNSADISAPASPVERGLALCIRQIAMRLVHNHCGPERCGSECEKRIQSHQCRQRPERQQEVELYEECKRSGADRGDDE